MLRSPALLAAILVLAACGGDGGGDRLSAEEYRQQANEICAEANTDLRALQIPDSLDELDAFVADAKPIVDRALEDLDDLEPPQELDGDHDRWVDQNRRMAEALDDLTDASLPEVSAKAQEFGRLNQEANESARDDLGLEDCGPESG